MPDRDSDFEFPKSTSFNEWSEKITPRGKAAGLHVPRRDGRLIRMRRASPCTMPGLTPCSLRGALLYLRVISFLAYRTAAQADLHRVALCRRVDLFLHMTTFSLVTDEIYSVILAIVVLKIYVILVNIGKLRQHGHSGQLGGCLYRNVFGRFVECWNATCVRNR
jgi:hypothetical protein